MLVGGKGLTCAGGKLFFFFRVMLREIVGSIFLSRRVFLSLTDLTDLTEHFHQRFDPTEGLRHTDITERYSQRRVLGDEC